MLDLLARLVAATADILVALAVLAVRAVAVFGA